MSFKILLLLCTVSLCSCTDQTRIDYIAEYLKVEFKVVNNLNGNNRSYHARITLENTRDGNIESGDWEIYFYSFHMIEPDHLPNPQGYVVDGFRFNHVNGRLFKFQPVADQFLGIRGESQHVINLVIAFWSVSKTDIMRRWYVTAPGRNPKTMVYTSDKDWYFVADFDSKNSYKRYAEDVYSPWTPQERYDRYNQYNASAKPKEIIPTPVEQEMLALNITVNSTWKMNCSVYLHECDLVRDYFQLQDRNMETSYTITFTQGEVTFAGAQALYMNESYELSVTSDRIDIKAPASSGAFYATQSLFALATKNESANIWSIPHATIRDAPRFQYRGMHVDVARNFIPKYEDIFSLLRAMATYKLNNLHIHLTDDEGWRIEIPDYPELTTVGGKRAHDSNETKSLMPQLGSGPTSETRGSGFYTREDYKEILELAASLHIRVIPEIDLPGHAHAAVKANRAYYNRLIKEGMSEDEAAKELISDLKDTSEFLSAQLFTDNVVNPCISGTYKFVRKVVKELIAMHHNIQNLTLFHLGGNEVADAWRQSPECKKILSPEKFPRSVSDLLQYFMITAIHEINDEKSDLKIGLWEDAALNNNVPYNKNDLTPNDVYTNAYQNIWELNTSSRAYTLANAGYKVVMSQATHLYFDHPYEPDPEERGFYWATRFTDIRKTFGFMPDNVYANADYRLDGNPITFDEVCPEEWCVRLEKPENIVGMQGQLFSETILSSDDFHYMIFPRLLALAERSWHKASWEATNANQTFDAKSRDQDWMRFATALSSREFKRLKHLRVAYRIPPPGVSRNKTTATISCEFSDVTVAFRHQYEAPNYTQCGTTVDLQTSETIKFWSYTSFWGYSLYSRTIVTDIGSVSAALWFQMKYIVLANVVCFMLMRECLS